nr:hypothetical protein [Tanacetum cinerariifolium]
NQSINVAMSPVCARSESSGGAEAAVFAGHGAAEPLEGLSWLVDDDGGGDGGTWADPEALEAPEDPEGPAGGGGGSG